MPNRPLCFVFVFVFFNEETAAQEGKGQAQGQQAGCRAGAWEARSLIPAPRQLPLGSIQAGNSSVVCSYSLKAFL